MDGLTTEKLSMNSQRQLLAFTLKWFDLTFPLKTKPLTKSKKIIKLSDVKFLFVSTQSPVPFILEFLFLLRNFEI